VAIVFLLAIVAGYLYMLHSRSQYDTIQYRLSQGIQSFAAYNAEEKQEDINKAEGIFNEIARKKKGKSYYIARLYLAKIQYIKGKSEDAKKIYQEILKDTSDSVLKTLSEKAIRQIDKK
jgi:predicted negative regulator of RcsB-dependent stress response